MHCRSCSTCTKHISSVFSFYSKATLYAVRTLVDSCGTINLVIRHYLVAPQIWRSWCCSFLHIAQTMACKSIYPPFPPFCHITNIHYKQFFSVRLYVTSLVTCEWVNPSMNTADLWRPLRSVRLQLLKDILTTFPYSATLSYYSTLLIICDQPLTLCSHSFFLCIDIFWLDVSSESGHRLICGCLCRGYTLLCWGFSSVGTVWSWPKTLHRF